MLFRERMDSPADTLSQYRFQQLVSSNLITQAIINYNPQNPLLTEITGKYRKSDGDDKTTTFTIEASMATVPEPANSATSDLVSKMRPRRSRVS